MFYDCKNVLLSRFQFNNLWHIGAVSSYNSGFNAMQIKEEKECFKWRKFRLCSCRYFLGTIEIFDFCFYPWWLFYWWDDFFINELGQGSSEGKKALYHCNYCNKDITGKIRIKCAVCPDFDLCIECFSVGAEVTSHKSNHPYRVMVCVIIQATC